MVESFWAVPDVTDIRTPLSILREQAAAITEQTKGTLVGVVDAQAGSNGDLEIQLELSVPSLNGYRYRILAYEQPIELYPGRMRARNESGTINDEKDFISTIKTILSSGRVRNVLIALLAQAREA